jgi:hypothetical protein
VDRPAELECEVRRCLRREAATVLPSGADLASRSVEAGRRRHALQGVVGLAAVAVATALAAGALPYSPDPHLPPPQLGFAYPEPDPAVTATPHVWQLAELHALATDASVAVVGDRGDGRLILVTADGTGTGLGRLRDVISAHQVGEGWAVVTGAERRNLWWVENHQQRPLLVLSNLDAVAVDRSGVAWRRGPVLSAARLSPGGALEEQVDTRVDGRVDPLGFLGGAVLLGHTGTDSELVGWDVWWPVSGAYVPGPTEGVDRVFGVLPGEGTAVGLAAVTGQPCLALLQVGNGLAVEATICMPGLPGVGPAALSPDGRWLLGTGAASGDGSTGAVLVDLDAALAGDQHAATAVSGVPAPVGRPVWPGPGSAVYLSTAGAVRVWPERVMSGAPEPTEVLAIPGDPALVLALT